METTIPEYRAPAAYGWSITIHVTIVAVLAAAGWILAERQESPPKIFVLVAGAGQNLDATEAPNIGTENGIKFETPKSAPAPQPAAPEPAADPTPALPLEAVPPPEPAQPPAKPLPKEKPATAPTSSSPIDFDKARRRSEIKVESRAKMKALRERREKEKRDRLLAKNKGLSYEQYLRDQTGTGVNTRGHKGGVVHGTSTAEGASGRALTAEQADEMTKWMAYLRDRIRENFVAPADFDERMTAHVKWYVSAGGTISNVRVTHSNGNEAFTAAVLEAFQRARVPPPPNHKGDEYEVDFSLHDET